VAEMTLIPKIVPNTNQRARLMLFVASFRYGLLDLTGPLAIPDSNPALNDCVR